MTTDPAGAGWQEAAVALAQAQTRTAGQLTALTERVGALVAAQTKTNQQLATLAARVDQLAAAQVRTEERLNALIVRMDELAQRVDALAVRMDELTQRVDALAAAQERTNQQLATLTERVDALAEQVSTLVKRMGTMADQLNEVRGWALEARYRSSAPSYFAPIARRLHALSQEEVAQTLERAVTDGLLSNDDADDIELADIVCRGRRRDNDSPTYLVVEVSAGVGTNDVERAARRAALLAKSGTPALPLVAGLWLNEGAQHRAPELGVWQVHDGVVVAPEERR